jgi:hypothetical protein
VVSEKINVVKIPLENQVQWNPLNYSSIYYYNKTIHSRISNHVKIKKSFADAAWLQQKTRFRNKCHLVTITKVVRTEK